ncbi:hypothetical protein PGT21_002501 [Puccinia graminis f. sp. tritici]|uniref:C2H2-type domain-containing protein n=1 Tax=Puccinia graminis f. sp. tritici TaxID=56615 RepID=A0A5B0NQS5_PUCGR|nr:hypothetical protein PGT21_002501 [Puccinia graminis f. sp. tritici]KAA1090218.1 hypothetical protein PGTUg99_037253 [Puccinia graminis f. sp. tritici]
MKYRYWCEQCPQYFKTTLERQIHFRNTHQQTTDLQLYDSSIFPLQRQPDRLFHCPVNGCPFETQKPLALHAHARVCLRKLRGMTTNISRKLVPCGSQVFAIDAIPGLKLAWNKYARILICKDCHVGIPFEDLPVHAKRHGVVDLKEADVEALIDYLDQDLKVDTPVLFPNLPRGYNLQQPGEPVQGLFVRHGLTCDRDGFTCINQQSMKDHCDAIHSDCVRRGWSVGTSKIFCQTLSSGKHAVYFGVRYRHQPSGSLEGYQDITSDESEQESEQENQASAIPPESAQANPSNRPPGDKTPKSKLQPSSEPADTRRFPAPSQPDAPVHKTTTSISLAKSTGILAHIESYTEKRINKHLAFVKLVTNRFQPAFQPLIQKWLENRTQKLGSLSLTLRRAVLSVSTQIESCEVLDPLEGESSVAKYSTTLTQLLLFAGRCRKQHVVGNENPEQVAHAELVAIFLNTYRSARSPTEALFKSIDKLVIGFILFSNQFHRPQVQSPLEEFIALSFYKGSHDGYDSALKFVNTLTKIQYCIQIAMVFSFCTEASIFETYLKSKSLNPSQSQMKESLKKHRLRFFRPLHNNDFNSPFITLRDWKQLGLNALEEARK